MRALPASAVLWCLWQSASTAVASDGAVHLDFAADDIERVTLEEDAAYLQLTPAGTSALRSITEKNRGRMLSVTIEGIPAVTATVVATIDSGRVLIQAPSPKLRERLAEIERAKSAR